MDNASTCFFYFFLLKSFSIYIHRGAMVNCEKIISQLGKNIFPVGQILFPCGLTILVDHSAHY